jgi:hypothetical protein
MLGDLSAPILFCFLSVWLLRLHSRCLWESTLWTSPPLVP